MLTVLARLVDVDTGGRCEYWGCPARASGACAACRLYVVYLPACTCDDRASGLDSTACDNNHANEPWS